MMIIDNKFKIKDLVYLKTDRDQFERLVTAISVRDSSINYELTFGATSSWHSDYEISVEKDIKILTEN